MKKQTMKNGFLCMFLGLIFVLGFAGNGWSDEGDDPCTVMRPDRETRLEWIKAYEDAPKAFIDKSISIPRGSYSLLSHLQYTPSERSQGSCGNCWAWAGTGVMGIALDVEESVLDRLSVQYNNSCGGTGSDFGCCGGCLSDLADFYSSTGYEQAIPWSNTNASWQDGSESCNSGTGSTSVPCGSIATSPDYPINSIDAVSIETHNVGQTTAIANIKNILNQDRAIWFGFFMPTNADGNQFQTWWSTQSESSIFNMDYTCGHTWNDGWGHAVLCVGYNDDDPNNRYWIMVNSWSTAGGGRPNGIFRLDMDMNYDCTYYNYPYNYYSLYWQTLDIEYTPIDQPDLVVLSIETVPVEPDPGESVNVYVTVKNESSVAASGFHVDWYADMGLPPSPSQAGDEYESVASLAAGATYTMGRTYTYSTTGIYNMYAQVDTNQEVTESNESNNVLGAVSILVGRCECDLNHDGRCDMEDWLLFGEDWGRTDCPIPGECIVDQEQLIDDYGYWFEETVVRWQEFFPEGNRICRVEVKIYRTGDPPADVLMAIEDDLGTTLWSTTIPQASVPIGVTWVSADVPDIIVNPGGSYKLKVWSDGPSPDPQNRYFWQSTDREDVYPGSSSADPSDFTFRTYKRSAVGAK